MTTSFTQVKQPVREFYDQVMAVEKRMEEAHLELGIPPLTWFGLMQTYGYHVVEVKTSDYTFGEICDWCATNIADEDYANSNWKFFFSNESDATMFKLKFG